MDDNWRMYTDYWKLFTNINTDDVNHPCFGEHRDERGRIWNMIVGKLNLENNPEGFSFDYFA